MRRKWLITGLLTALTFLTFAGVGKLGFVNYDDPDYVTANRIVQAGLTPNGLAWAFGRIHGSETYWHPLTWVTHMIDCQFFGLNAGAHHLVSLAWHTASVILLFFLLHRSTGAFWTSAAIAALFAVHPIQVESVAWVTERKNVVSTFFALLTLFAYIKYTEGRKALWYGAAILSFILALMSKPAVVTIPCVMLLFDFWPLRRLKIFDDSGRRVQGAMAKSKNLFIEKLPFFLLSIISSALTIAAHRELGMLAEETGEPAGLTFGNIIVSYLAYIRKVFWPVDLAAFYPFPKSIPPLDVAASLIILIVISVVALLNLKRRPYLIVGWLWFVGVLFPTIGVVHVGIQAMADRFMYVPIIGVLLIVCFAAKERLVRSQNGRKVAVIGAAFVLLSCISLSRAQVNYWKDDFALFEHARRVTKDNYMACTSVASAYLKQGEFEAAMTNLQTALEIQPTFAEAHFTVGIAMLYKGRFPEAANEFQEALRLKPRYYEARFHLARTFQLMGNIDAAISNFQEALLLQPDLVPAHLGLGDMLLARGRFKEALGHFREAINLDPNSSDALGRLAWLLATHNDPRVRNGPDAVVLAEKACRMTNFSEAQPLNALAAAYAETGKFDLAVSTAQKALEAARAKNQTGLIPMTESLLKLYQSGKPYREGND